MWSSVCVCLVASNGDWALDPVSLGRQLGPVVLCVLGVLFLMSVWSLGVILDRALMYAAARRQSRIFVEQVAGALREGKLDEAIRIAERNNKSHIAEVTASGLTEFRQAVPRMKPDRVVEATERRQARSIGLW